MKPKHVAWCILNHIKVYLLLTTPVLLCFCISERYVTHNDEMGKYELRLAVKKLYQLRPKVSASSVSAASQGDRFKCINCVLKWLLQVYQLRPAVGKELHQLRPGLSTPSVTSCVPRLVRNCISCVQSCLLLAYYWCPESSTARVWVASKNMSIQNVQQFKGSYTVLLYITLYTIICTRTEVLNDIDNAQMLYHVTVNV